MNNQFPFSSMTEKSKQVIYKALTMTENCGFKYLEPQIIMAGIVNEGRDMLTYIFQRLGINKVEFCQRVVTTIDLIQETSASPPVISQRTKEVILYAKELSIQNNCDLIPIEYLFGAVCSIPNPIKDIVELYNISTEQIIQVISEYRANVDLSTEFSTISHKNNYEYLNRFATDLCKEAEQGVISQAIGRDYEIRKILRIISRKTKNNPILVGEPGTGKTAIVEGLAYRIIKGDLPRNLSNLRLFSLDTTSLIAGAIHQGEFEERLQKIIDEIVHSDEDILLFIDEIHLLIGDSRSSGSMDAANILKPVLAQGKMKIIGTTTLGEYKQYIEKDKAFARRFQEIPIGEPDEETTIAILRGIRQRLEDYHKIRIKDEAIRAAVKYSARYIQDRFLPDKAIDLLDETAAKMKIERSSSPEELDILQRTITTKEIEYESLKRDDRTNPIVSQLQEEIANLKEKENILNAKWQSERHILDDIQIRRNEIYRLTEEMESARSKGNVSAVISMNEQVSSINEEINRLTEIIKENGGVALLKPEMDEADIISTITEWTGIPLSKLNEKETEKLIHIEDFLHKSVIGQEEAIAAVSNAIRRNRLGFSDTNKPIGSFLFLGTTGVGKTELCKALGEYLFDSKDSLIRIDMSEYQQEHEVSKLFGAPPGYIGYEAGGQLTEAVRRKPYSVILFDEIEKAHPKVFETLLQVLDDGRMTDGQGRTVNFKNTIIVMTSNLGQQTIYSTLQGKHKIRKERIGFVLDDNNNNAGQEINVVTESTITTAKNSILAELKHKVAPEFINRIDNIVIFLPLTKDDVLQIVKLQLSKIKMLMESKGINLIITNEAVAFIAKVGYQPEYGARPIKRAITTFLIDELSIRLINGEVSKINDIKIDSNSENLTFTNI